MNKLQTLQVSLVVLALAMASLSMIVPIAEAQTTYTYIFQGPFYFSGAVDHDDSVLCNVKWSNMTTSTVVLSSGNFAQSLSSNYYIKEINWNASSAQNYTSQMVLKAPTSTSNIPINIYIPNPNQPAFMYTFPVTSFIPITNAYMAMQVNIAGVSSTLAQQVSLDAAGVPTFVMQQFETYTLTITCNEGTYSQQFSAQNIQSTTIALLSGAFGTNTTGTLSVYAKRTASDTINVYFNDPNSTTTSINAVIAHKLGTSDVYDYNQTVTSSIYNAAITVNAATDYFVTLTTTQSGQQIIYKFACPQTVIPSNYFAGKIPFLGFSGLDLTQVFAAGVILCCLGVGSKWSTGFSCFAAVIMAGLFLSLGLFTIGVPTIFFAGVLAVFIFLKEGKEQSGEI